MSEQTPSPAKSDRPPVATGGCQCGAVRYACYTITPAGDGVCHCRMCQKAVGGPFAVFVGVPAADFAWTRGTPKTFRSSTHAERDFCPDCGTPLTFRWHDGATVSVTVGSLDNPEVGRPDRQIGTESRLAWVEQIWGLPKKTTAEDSGADFIAACISYQHPDHDTPDDWSPPLVDRPRHLSPSSARRSDR